MIPEVDLLRQELDSLRGHLAEAEEQLASTRAEVQAFREEMREVREAAAKRRAAAAARSAGQAARPLVIPPAQGAPRRICACGAKMKDFELPLGSCATCWVGGSRRPRGRF